MIFTAFSRHFKPKFYVFLPFCVKNISHDCITKWPNFEQKIFKWHWELNMLLEEIAYCITIIKNIKFLTSVLKLAENRPVTGHHMRCAKKEHLNMMTCTPGLPVIEWALWVPPTITAFALSCHYLFLPQLRHPSHVHLLVPHATASPEAPSSSWTSPSRSLWLISIPSCRPLRGCWGRQVVVDPGEFQWLLDLKSQLESR